MFNVGIIASRKAAHPVGEVLLTSGSAWVVPAGVTSVSVVVIGRGGDGVQFPGNKYGGGGGALAYKNNIAVTPGQTVSYNASGYGGNNFSIFGVTAGNGSIGGNGYGSGSGGTASGGDANFSGGAGAYEFSSMANGGGAATYTSNGANGSGAGISAYGPTGGGTSYGAGGQSVYSGSPTVGGPGVIRIIWGVGRGFPNNAQ